MEVQDLLADGGSSSELTLDGGCRVLAGNVWEGDRSCYISNTFLSNQYSYYLLVIPLPPRKFHLLDKPY